MSPASRCREPTSRIAATYFSSYWVRAGSGRLASEPDMIKRQPQLVPGLEQERIEQGPVFARRVELLDQSVERGRGPSCAQRVFERRECARRRLAGSLASCARPSGCVSHGSIGSSRCVESMAVDLAESPGVTRRPPWRDRSPWPAHRAGRRPFGPRPNASRSTSTASDSSRPACRGPPRPSRSRSRGSGLRGKPPLPTSSVDVIQSSSPGQ